MFEWRSSAPNPIKVNSGPLAPQTFFGPMAGFGESLVTTGPITGDVVYVGRGCDPAYPIGSTIPPALPLDPYLANPAGKIALIDRGTCGFVGKVKKAQDLGALMVIVVNNTAAAPTAMGGADPSITIPSVMISLADGNLFKASRRQQRDGLGRDGRRARSRLRSRQRRDRPRVRARHLEPPHRRPRDRARA